jgi:hypothetical protein
MSIATSARHTALLLAFALPFSLSARADEASHRAKAQELMTLQDQRMVQQISDNIMKQVTEAAEHVAGPNPTPEVKAKADDVKKQAAQLVNAQLGWDSMKAGITDIYVKSFTEEQLDAIIAFYKTPAGAALLETMPAINSQVTQLGGSRMSTLRPQLTELFQAFQKSQAPASPTLGPVAPSAPATPSTASPSQPK